MMLINTETDMPTQYVNLCVF